MPDETKAEGRVAPDGQAFETKPPSDTKPKRRIRPVFIIAFLVLIGAVYIGITEVHKRLTYIFEEDARIQTDLVTVSSRVAGWITEMPAAEGETVEESTVLVQVDDRESRIFLIELEAQAAAANAERTRLAAERILIASQIESRMQSERARVSAAEVVVSSLRPQRELAERELNRAKKLFDDKVASRRQLDQAEAQHQQIDREYRIAVAELQSAKSRIAEVEADRARLDVLAGEVLVLEQKEAEIRARIQRQRLDISDRTIKSPINGIVDKTFVDAGEYVTPGQRLLLTHNPEKIWVEANVKETVVRKLKVGQKVDIHIDAYPDEAFDGTVQNIGSAATSQFALLPTPNPSGNFTKITQRLPIRIAINNTDPRLRPGMMVVVKIAIQE
ncbi:HlyD family secretion protein [Thalassospiraceae bacterium LMO-JJ14]|nr:HlyD family secretion protein [Thalassospiraceae bacterium LMO-JJ14]